MNNRQAKTLLTETTTGSIIGAIAGQTAHVAVGFKEAMINNAIGSAFNRGVCYALEQKAGFSKMSAELAAFALTLTLDVGGLHSFGGNSGPINGEPVISYKPEDGLVLHHVVFYTALLLGYAGANLYNNRHSLFGSSIANASTVVTGNEAELTESAAKQKKCS